MTTPQDILRRCEAHALAALGGAPGKRVEDLTVYLSNVGAGLPMRAIARARNRPASTVLRAVRRVESLRDDPLLDRVLTRIETDLQSDEPSATVGPTMKTMTASLEKSSTAPRLSQPERAALMRLAEPDAFLLIAEGAAKGGVFCAGDKFAKPVALLPVETVTRFAAHDWVRCVRRTDLTARYVLTAAGRGALRRKIEAERPRAATGFAEAPSVFTGQQQLAGERRVANPETGEIETIRVNLGESPLGWLAKRRDAKGDCLLKPEEVEAGERLREDYEMAQMGPRVGQDWRRFLTPGERGAHPGRTPSEGPMFARERVAKAVEALGPGLSDAAIRICCFLEGLEATERRMGWSARSGKVVLKLALQRLVDHYGLRRRETKSAA